MQLRRLGDGIRHTRATQNPARHTRRNETHPAVLIRVESRHRSAQQSQRTFDIDRPALIPLLLGQRIQISKFTKPRPPRIRNHYVQTAQFRLGSRDAPLDISALACVLRRASASDTIDTRQ